MTALERAKVFVKSRAAKTALRIMPLALATVVSVGTKAHANTLPTFSGSFTEWQTANCSSGGIAACLQPFPNTSGNPVPYLTNGSQSSGSASGTYVVKSSPGFPATLSYLMSGNGTGDLTTPIAVQFDVSITCPTCSSLDTFSFQVSGDVDNTSSQTFSADSATYVKVGDSFDATGSFLISPVSGTLQDWQTQIDFSWAGNAGEAATFDVNQLAIYPTSGTSSVPEPGSLLLALSGLPLIGRLLRRKR
jgi:hypothetical protein